MRRIVCLIVLLVGPVGQAFSQHGTAPSGYYPMGYAGDIFTGEVMAVNDATREITLTYRGRKKDETFVGVLQEHYTLKDRNGTAREIKPSNIPIGTRLTVYYKLKKQKVEGKKVKSYSLFRITTPPKKD